MDLVNSVTQNSNDRQTTMENKSISEVDGVLSATRVVAQSASSASAPTQATPATTTTMSTSTSKASSQLPDYLKAIGMDPRKFWPKKYRFTREKSPGMYNPLNIGQRNFYENNGYIVLNDCISSKLVSLVKQQVSKQTPSATNILEKLTMKNDKLTQYIKCFCDERAMLMTATILPSFQTASSVRELIDASTSATSALLSNDNSINARQQLFRDWMYLPFRPIDKVVCTITAIEPIEHVILVVPGTHRVGQCTISSTLNNLTRVYDSSQDKSAQLISREVFECAPENLSALVEKSKVGFKYINLRAGQTLFYHPGLVHGFSDDLINLNKRQTALVAVYAAADCEYIDLSTSSELMANKLRPANLRHFGDSNPSDYRAWIDKPRLLRDARLSHL